MKITQDVREYAKEQGVEAEKAMAAGMAERLRSLRQREVRFIKEICQKLRNMVIK